MKIEEENIKVVKYKPHGVAKNLVKHELWLARTPIVIHHGNVEYRVVPMYRDIAVSNMGEILDLVNKSILKPSRYGKYLVVTTRDYLNDRVVALLIHRLVALAWVKNDDYEARNIVDHIDGNKLNNFAYNLRWLSNADNVSSFSHGRLFRFLCANMQTSTITSHNSLAGIARYLGIDKRLLRINGLPRIQVVDSVEYLIADGRASKDILTEYMNLKYPYKVYKIHDVSRVRYFKTKKELYDGFDLKSNYQTIKNATKELKRLGYRLVCNANGVIQKMYDVKNLETGEEHKNLDLNTVISVTGIPRGTVLSRINREYKYGKPMGYWVLKFSNESEYESCEIKKCKTYIIKKDSDIQTFSSLRKLAKYLGCDRHTIKKAIAGNTTLNGYSIKVS